MRSFALALLWICIPCSVVRIGDGCFDGCVLLSVVAFERDSKLRTTGLRSFLICGGLKSICLPASVEAIPSGCFSFCASLCNLVFARDSQLAAIEAHSFLSATGLKAICLPARLTDIGW
jgi:hypothetical protein